MKHLNERGSSVTVALLAVGAVVLLAAFGWLILTRNEANDPSAQQNRPTALCRTEDPLAFCITLSRTEVQRGDELTLAATIRNTSAEAYKAVFPTTCTEPALYVNGEERGKPEICGEAITEVEIESGQAKEYEVSVDTAFLNDGENQLKLIWDNHESGTAVVSFTP